MQNSSKRHIDVWEECLRIIQQNITPQQYETWFKPIRPVSLSDCIITLEVPTDYFRLYLEEAFIDILSKTLKRVIGPGAKLKYVYAPVQGQQKMVIDGTPGAPAENNPVPITTVSPSANTGPLVFPGVKKMKIDPRLNPYYRFSTMIEGECNKLGISAGVDISDKPGKTPFNPLFIFGGSGLGKTHLAQAIGNAIKEKYQECVVFYVTSSEFQSRYVDATTVNNNLTAFLSFFMKIDVLIMDDIQDLKGHGTQNAFFNIFNYLHQHGRQLIFTSDSPAKDLANFEERLLSRFKWGLSVELKRPDYNTRLEMLRARSQREGLIIPDEVLRHIALKVTGNFRELEGVLISLMATSTFTHRDCSIELADQVLEHIVKEEKSELTIDKVQGAVCEYFNISRADLVSGSRKRAIVQARQISMFLCRNMIPNCSLSSIGAQTGGKDHSTVLHSCSTVSDLMSTDRVFKNYVEELQRLLQP